MSSFLDLYEACRFDIQRSPEVDILESYRSNRETGVRRVKIRETWHQEKCLYRADGRAIMLKRRVGDSSNESRMVFKELWKDPRGKTSKIQGYKEARAMGLFSRSVCKDLFVCFHGWAETNDQFIMLMEYLEHGSLTDCLPEGAGLVESETCSIVNQVLEGLLFMHDAKIVHQDLKPDNLFVVAHGPDWWVKIGDFGISFSQDSTFLAGYTRGYHAPEYAMLPSLEFCTPAVDMWSLGCVAHYLTTRKVPLSEPNDLQKLKQTGTFGTNNLSTTCGISSSYCHFLQGLLKVDPALRLTCNQALKSAWILEHRSGAGVVEGTSKRPATIITPKAVAMPSDSAVSESSMPSTISVQALRKRLEESSSHELPASVTIRPTYLPPSTKSKSDTAVQQTKSFQSDQVVPQVATSSPTRMTAVRRQSAAPALPVEKSRTKYNSDQSPAQDHRLDTYSGHLTSTTTKLNGTRDLSSDVNGPSSATANLRPPISSALGLPVPTSPPTVKVKASEPRSEPTRRTPSPLAPILSPTPQASCFWPACRTHQKMTYTEFVVHCDRVHGFMRSCMLPPPPPPSLTFKDTVPESKPNLAGSTSGYLTTFAPPSPVTYCSSPGCRHIEYMTYPALREHHERMHRPSPPPPPPPPLSLPPYSPTFKETVPEEERSTTGSLTHIPPQLPMHECLFPKCRQKEKMTYSALLDHHRRMHPSVPPPPPSRTSQETVVEANFQSVRTVPDPVFEPPSGEYNCSWPHCKHKEKMTYPVLLEHCERVHNLPDDNHHLATNDSASQPNPITSVEGDRDSPPTPINPPSLPVRQSMRQSPLPPPKFDPSREKSLSHRVASGLAYLLTDGEVGKAYVSAHRKQNYDPPRATSSTLRDQNNSRGKSNLNDPNDPPPALQYYETRSMVSRVPPGANHDDLQCAMMMDGVRDQQRLVRALLEDLKGLEGQEREAAKETLAKEVKDLTQKQEALTARYGSHT